MSCIVQAHYKQAEQAQQNQAKLNKSKQSMQRMSDSFVEAEIAQVDVFDMLFEIEIVRVNVLEVVDFH